MKVLFAVNDENISTSIVKKYQKQYKEIISYKNVYYFNAILKELQRNKSYDRVVISEDLEEFTSSSYEQKDKFIFDRLDNISDEAISTNGVDIPIIIICSERRTKGESILVKLFSISVYNAILGDDRTTDEVCRLINKPRTKKEAKLYYKIDSDDAKYEREKENEVSEMELQNILRHFKRLGKNEQDYVESFNNIVSQYNKEQMKVVIAVLPENVKNILQEHSVEYKKIVGYDSNVSNVNPYNSKKMKKGISKTLKTKPKTGTSEKLLETKEKKLTKPVVVPTTLDKNIYKKVEPAKEIDIHDFEEDDEIEDDVQKILEEIKPKRRGRPRKNSTVEETVEEIKPKRRGRPRKNPIIEDIEENEKLDEDDEYLERQDFESTDFENNMLPGFDDDENDEDINDYNIEENTLPGFDDEDDGFDTNNEFTNDSNVLDNNEEDDDTTPYLNNNSNDIYMRTYDNVFDDEEFEGLLSKEKKVVSFVGTSKNGTSFIVNNVAMILSNMGINTAILDATSNKNAYYIYTKNDDELRKIASNSFENLTNEIAEGIKVNNNLTVYTTIPSKGEQINDSRPILETLIRNHSLVLIDCDFSTPIEYFDKSQEIYLVQTMDVLTIQPLTEFLRELKVKNVLEDRKIRIVLNKLLKIKGVNAKNIIGGMSNYNDPEMSFMTELFNRNTVKLSAQIPFDEDVYIKYLSYLVECEIQINGYPKEFKQILNNLAESIYPLLPGTKSDKKNKKSTKPYTSSFSEGMNTTLDNMRKKY